MRVVKNSNLSHSFCTHNFQGPKKICPLVWKQVNDDAESEPQICQCKPGERKSKDIVLGYMLDIHLWPNFENAHQCLNVKEYHANKTVARSVKGEEVDEGILFDMV